MTEINLKIKDLCSLVEGSSNLDPSFVIKNVSPINSAGSNDLAVVFDPEEVSVFEPLSLEKIKLSNAGIILASQEFVPEKNYLIVEDTVKALEKLSNFIYQIKSIEKSEIHKTSVVDESVTLGNKVIVEEYSIVKNGAFIGDDSRICSHVFIGKDCKIGCNCIIHPGARILDRCVIGDYSVIQSGAVIGSDGFGYRMMKNGLRKIPHVGIVRVGKGVEIGANTTIDRAAFEETLIGDGSKIDNNVQVAHNVKIGPHTAILSHTAIGGSVTIGACCQIGGQVAIRDHIRIGNNVKIVSKSGVMKNLKDGEVVSGIPAMPFNTWKRLMVYMSKLPALFKFFGEAKNYANKMKDNFSEK